MGYSIGAIVAIFVLADLVLDQIGQPMEHAGVYVMLGTIILSAIIWSATGMAVTKIHTLLTIEFPGQR